MPTPRSRLASIVVNGKIYAMGGASGVSDSMTTVEVYDPDNDSWEAKANMPTYDPQTDEWTSIASITIARGALAGATAHGRVYVMGGRDCCNAYPTVEEYDPVRNTWATRASMGSTSPINVAASEVNGRIYAIGGSDFNSQGSSLVLEYTPPAAAKPNELSAQILTRPDGALSYVWKGAAGVRHQVEVSSDLLTWEPFGEPVVGAGNTQQVLQIVLGKNAGFLRVRALAAPDS